MRLFNIESQTLEEFIGSQCPPYAILSHRWSPAAEELTFKEVYKNRIDRHKPGYQKLVGACRAAQKYNLSYLWVDTFCIDKRSSAELSEAINSMFSWYQNARVCLVYLMDVRSGFDKDGNEIEIEDRDEAFKNSEWFNRAWTLQELLAPRLVFFFNCAWEYIGTKQSRASMIQEITGIPDSAVEKNDSLWQFEVDAKMTWASNRLATRVEDIAYSLMGLFGVNMPLLYGEGNRAFERLQEEIIRRAKKLSFLIWGIDTRSTHKLLADSPTDFDRVTKIIPEGPINRAFSTTNLGLKLRTQLFRCGIDIYGIVLGYIDKIHLNGGIIVMLLRQYRESVFYKVRVISMSLFFNSFEGKYCAEDRSITIMHGTSDQYIESQRECDNHEAVGAPYSLRVQCTPSIVLRTVPAKQRYGDVEARWDETSERPGLEATFPHPARWEIARMTCELSSNWFLLLAFALDFDSRPCLLVQQFQSHHELLVVAQERKVALPLVSSNYPGNDVPPFKPCGCWGDIKMRNVTEDKDIPTFFFRGNQKWLRLDLELPPELLPPGRVYWLSIRRVRHQNSADSWNLEVSDMTSFSYGHKIGCSYPRVDTRTVGYSDPFRVPTTK